jgi:FMN reductase
MPARTLVVVAAGLSQPSSTRLLADRLTAATERLLRDAGTEPEAHVFELRDYAQDLANNLLAGFPAPRLRAATDTLVAADGLIAVSPIFAASYSGLFKLFFDVLDRDSLAGLPVLMGATGGTARHSLALEHAVRPLFAYLGAATVPTAVFAAPEDWGQRTNAGDEDLVERIERAAQELATSMTLRRRETPVDPFTEPTPFEQLLGGDR